ncbi:unnamed protein product [Eretmochelys imbricata]
MAEYVAHPSSAWHSGSQPPHTSALCPLELMDLGVTEQAPPLEQPPPSLDLGGEEDIDSPLDPDVPYPDLAPVVFFCLKQTTSPRNWCIKMVCNPYPFRAACSLFGQLCPSPPHTLAGRPTGKRADFVHI